MQYQRFVIESHQKQGESIQLTEAQTHYLRRVLRLSEGDRAIALTGTGMAWIVELTPDQAKIIAPIAMNTELTVNVTLLISLPKQGFDEIVRCCTELGVTTMVPVLSERTVLNPSANKLTRWQRIAAEASEQSERAIVPKIQPPIAFTQALGEYSGYQGYCCTARHDVPLFWDCFPSQLDTNQPLIIATGCEGGWTDLELLQAQQAQFQLVSFEKRILRAVTAPIAVMSLVAAYSD